MDESNGLLSKKVFDRCNTKFLDPENKGLFNSAMLVLNPLNVFVMVRAKFESELVLVLAIVSFLLLFPKRLFNRDALDLEPLNVFDIEAAKFEIKAVFER